MAHISIRIFALVLAGAPTLGAANQVTVETSGSQTCITSNGLPDHGTGTFPNPNNPHAMRAQNTRVCVPAAPEKGRRAQEVTTVGIARNGVLIRPGTADYFDAGSRRGHSRNPASGWNLEGMGSSEMLGLDANNAHVDQRGLYHYHGVPKALISGDTQIGWAADGFEIHYVGNAAVPSYQLKSGRRPTAPGGQYDGSYVEDFQFKRGTGNLDKCNGAMMGGKYVYFATDSFPFFPRCLYGTQITRIR